MPLLSASFSTTPDAKQATGLLRHQTDILPSDVDHLRRSRQASKGRASRRWSEPPKGGVPAQEVAYLREDVCDAVLLGVVQGGEADHAPIIDQLRDGLVQLAEAAARAGLQLVQQQPGLRIQELLQCLLQQFRQPLRSLATCPGLFIVARSQPCC